MTKIQFYKYEHMVVRFMCEFIQVYNIRLSGGYYKKYKNSWNIKQNDRGNDGTGLQYFGAIK